MRLLIVSARHHSSHGGIGTAVWHFIQHTCRRGWDVELLTRPSPTLPDADKVHLVETPDLSPGFAEHFSALRRVHRIRPYRYGMWSLAVAEKLLTIRLDFDAIEFIDSQAEGFVALTSHEMRQHVRDTPMYIRAHTPMYVMENRGGMNVQQFGRSIYHQWERTALESADGVIAPSSLLLHEIHARAAAIVIPNIVEPTPTNHVPGALKSHHILFIGPLEPNKGVECLARSLNRIFKADAMATATLLGMDTPTAPDGSSMLDHFMHLIDKDSQSRVVWMALCDSSQVRQYMCQASVVLVPSMFESFSYVAAEAVAMGRPVIVSSMVGLREWVPSLPCVEPNDDAGLADAVLAIFRRPEAIRQRMQECRDEMLQSCRPERILDLNESFIEDLRRTTRPAQTPRHSLQEMREFLLQIETEAGMAFLKECGQEANSTCPHALSSATIA